MIAKNRSKAGYDTNSADRVTGESRIQKVGEKVTQYRKVQQEGDEQAKSQGPVRNMEEWTDIVSQRIEEAMRSGAFDNLPGRGRPLDLQRDPFMPKDQQLANQLLKNNDLVPAWIAERKQVQHDIKKFYAKLRHALAQVETQYTRASDAEQRAELRRIWQLWVEEWKDEVDLLNKRISDQNLRQPVDHLEIHKIRLEEELDRADISHFVGGSG